MAPGNNFLAQVARLVPEEELPPLVGMAAFELVSTLEHIRSSWQLRRSLRPNPRATPRANIAKQHPKKSPGNSEIQIHE